MKALLVLAALAIQPQPGQSFADADCADAIVVKENGSLVLVRSNGKEQPIKAKDVEMIAKDRIIYGNKLYLDPSTNESVCD